VNSSIQDTLLKRSFYNDYYIWKKRARREEVIVRNAKNFFGRTEWDSRMVKLFNNEANYFHCDEVLRPAFYNNQWEYKKNGLMTLVTTINPTLYKGLDTVLETAELLKETFRVSFQWKILGIRSDNKLVKLLEKIKMKEFSKHNVIFLGPKSEAEVVSELKSSDIFIHPSHIDNSPNSVCEAMLMGMPVIASNVGGIPSLVQHNVTGFLFNSNDPFELASMIIDIGKNESQVLEITKKSREVAMTRHNYETIIERVVDTYKQILKA
jgi:glycosyltransferase involved in cell wall biosynthesis